MKAEKIQQLIDAYGGRNGRRRYNAKILMDDKGTMWLGAAGTWFRKGYKAMPINIEGERIGKILGFAHGAKWPLRDALPLLNPADQELVADEASRMAILGSPYKWKTGRQRA